MASEKTPKETSYQRSNSQSSRSTIQLLEYGKLAATGADHLQNNGYGNGVMHSMTYDSAAVQLKKRRKGKYTTKAGFPV